MPFNLLLLPLLGGFAFVRRWNYTKFYALRSDGYILIFYAATAGVFSLAIAGLICKILYPYLQIHSPLFGPDSFLGGICRFIDEGLQRMAPIEHIGTATLAFVLGGTLWWPLNKIWKRQPQLDRVLYESGDPLELLLQKSLYETRPIIFSLKSGKVYIGLVSRTIFTENAAFPAKSFKFIPLVSGYRKQDNHKVHFTIDYSKVIEKVKKKDPEVAHLRLEDFEIVVPIEEIRSANIFDTSIYNNYFRAQVQLIQNES